MTILASRMAKLDMGTVSEKTDSSIVAIAISAQPGLTRECIAAAAGSDGLDLVHQLSCRALDGRGRGRRCDAAWTP